MKETYQDKDIPLVNGKVYDTLLDNDFLWLENYKDGFYLNVSCVNNSDGEQFVFLSPAELKQFGEELIKRATQAGA